MIVSPLQEALETLHQRFLDDKAGAVATYIPELARANPAAFAISVATVDGHRYAVGDASASFTIQSISKPFVYALAVHDLGIDEVLRRVGVEPSGEAFNAISLEPVTGRPRNPMINAGAIASASLVAGDNNAEKLERVLAMLASFAGRTLAVDSAVYRSESATGHRNRAIGYLLRNAGIVGDDVEDVLDRYFRQCSALVTADDLAVMAATLANGGVNPITGERAVEHAHVASVLSVMSTCGMYDYAGSWLLRVGMPAKSGVAGGIIAVLPGQLGIGVYSPPLDEFGNSVRGVAVCETFSREFGLHLLRPPVHPASVVATIYPLSDVSSKRRRTELEVRCLAERGEAVRIIRLQGPLVFSTGEVALRRAIEAASIAHTIVFDCQRVQSIDAAACRLFRQFVGQLMGDGGTAVFAGLCEGDGWEPLFGDLGGENVQSFATIDLALEWCEDRILADAPASTAQALEIDIDLHPLLAGLSAHERVALRSTMARTEIKEGATIVRQGDAADSLFLLTAGDVSISLDLGSGATYRLATLGPGAVFGELALLDDQPRTANIHAETAVVCWVLRRDNLPALNALAPGAQLKLTESLARHLASRLRRADSEIMALAN
jgi:glutaminase